MAANKVTSAEPAPHNDPVIIFSGFPQVEFQAFLVVKLSVSLQFAGFCSSDLSKVSIASLSPRLLCTDNEF